MPKKLILLLSGWWVFFACNKPAEDKLFVLKTPAETGITFSNNLHPTPELNILTYLYYYNGGGVAAGDFNNDGLPDLYFVSNSEADQLYLNKGQLTFEEVTVRAGIENITGWSTGVTTADVNADGLLDIYLSRVGNYQSIQGTNQLYINQGNNAEGIPRFKEEAAAYGLDISSFSTQAAFVDFDNDGDLDFYLLNHSVHPNGNYGNGSKRDEPNLLAGDRIYRNDNDFFTDITPKTGIHSGIIGYGLGLGLGDLNDDGFTDIYITNDFFENDYLYVNNQNFGFEDFIPKKNRSIGHTSHFSMGVDLADFNNDGLTDIFTLDMLPENPITYQTAGRDYPFQIYTQYQKNGYDFQFMQNTLQQNTGDMQFSETAYFSGIAATDWSWSPLLADFDNDGHKDLFVSNGIPGATNDMDFINFIANDKIQKKISLGLTSEDLSLTKDLPEIKVANYFFRNTSAGTFENVSQQWANEVPSFSNGAVYVDLDRDGDLDLVTNNLNETAFVYENQTDTLQNKFLSIAFKGPDKNPLGIGAKVFVYNKNQLQKFENFTTRSYLSAVEPIVHVGLADEEIIDSLTIIWPGGKYQTFYQVASNRSITVDYALADGQFYKPKKTFPVQKQSLPFKHIDNEVLEFVRDPLVPYASTNLGPGMDVGDIDGDGLEDVVIGNGKWQKPALLTQNKDGSFTASSLPLQGEQAKAETTAVAVFDANGDGFPEVLLLNGGNEFTQGEALRPQFFINQNGALVFDEKAFSNTELNGSSILPFDFDKDGDLDLLLTANLLPWKFGQSASSFLFENDGKGHFKEVTQAHAPDLINIGNVFDAKSADFNQDGWPDLVLAGHWMPVTLLLNRKGRFEKAYTDSFKHSNGLWNTLAVADFDSDGQPDIAAGNWGLNTRLKAGVDEPLELYVNDFENNGSREPVVTYFYKGKRMAFASKDELTQQIPDIKKRYLSYRKFAEATFEEIFGEEKLKSSLKKEVYTLASTVFYNNGNSFEAQELPQQAQWSALLDFEVADFNHDGLPDLLTGGNWFELNTQLSRADASKGFIFVNQKDHTFKYKMPLNISGAVRKIQTINHLNPLRILVAQNNDSLVLIKLQP